MLAYGQDVYPQEVSSSATSADKRHQARSADKDPTTGTSPELRGCPSRSGGAGREVCSPTPKANVAKGAESRQSLFYGSLKFYRDRLKWFRRFHDTPRLFEVTGSSPTKNERPAHSW